MRPRQNALETFLAQRRAAEDQRMAALLERGVDAARSGDESTARLLLQRLVDSDATAEQKTKAWYALSQIAGSPAAKRECIENVLAIDPGHGGARRELAILDGRLKPEEVVDHRQPTKPIEPPTTLKRAEARRYVCPKCAGKLAFAPEQGALICGYCGYRASEYQAVMEGAVVSEQDFAATLPTARAHRWELPTARVFSCQGCGAQVTLPPARITESCPFCGSAYIATSKEEHELIEPTAVLPFRIAADQVVKQARRWLAEQSFRPKGLDRDMAFATPQPVYLPFWTFDVGGQTRWCGWVEKSGGSSLRVPYEDTFIVWHNDMLVPASHSLPAQMLDLKFDLQALAPYSADLLADWSVEIYQIPLADASLVARHRAAEAARAHPRNTPTGKDVTDLTFDSSGIIIESFKLVLLPVWLTSYRYDGKHHPLVVNGQGGVVHGQVPRSGMQKLLAWMMEK